MTSLRKLFSGLYKLCDCGCGILIPVVGKLGKPVKFKWGHNLGRGEKHHHWKGGRYKSRGYWMLLIPDYRSANRQGYVSEHVYFYESYHKCCMLSWGEVHHIDGDKKNNMPWNLQGMMHHIHSSISATKDKTGRMCKICLSTKTGFRKINGKLYESWTGDKKNGFVCLKCYMRIYLKKYLKTYIRKR